LHPLAGDVYETDVDGEEESVRDSEFNPAGATVLLDGLDDEENGVDEPDEIEEAAFGAALVPE
jgi:hypothetical protein